MSQIEIIIIMPFSITKYECNLDIFFSFKLIASVCLRIYALSNQTIVNNKIGQGIISCKFFFATFFVVGVCKFIKLHRNCYLQLLKKSFVKPGITKFPFKRYGIERFFFLLIIIVVILTINFFYF